MSFSYVSGNWALDFVGTLNERRTAQVENLENGQDVARWLVGAGILDEPPTTEADTLTEALVVREALFTLVESLLDRPDEPLPHTQLDRINEAAAHPPPTVTLGADGERRRSGSWRSGLSAVARDGMALTDLGDAVLKWCGNPTCTHPFIDRSRGHRRRWCEMAGCGDRAKAASYRARQRAAG